MTIRKTTRLVNRREAPRCPPVAHLLCLDYPGEQKTLSCLWRSQSSTQLNCPPSSIRTRVGIRRSLLYQTGRCPSRSPPFPGRYLNPSPPPIFDSVTSTYGRAATVLV